MASALTLRTTKNCHASYGVAVRRPLSCNFRLWQFQAWGRIFKWAAHVAHVLFEKSFGAAKNRQ
jgi:hypothetical protein